MKWTTEHVLRRLSKPRIEASKAPYYHPVLDYRARIGLAVESMKRHMTDEGWQIFAGLEHSGYHLCGADLPDSETDVEKILQRTNPAVIVVQDKREWEGLTADRSRDPRMRFHNIELLARQNSRFRVTILKDAHHNPNYHKDASDEMGCHAWIIYYHPRIVHHLAPYVRPQHLIRTYHSLDAHLVPQFSEFRQGALLSGAVSSAYPLRLSLVKKLSMLPQVEYVKHPGYHRKGCATPQYLKLLSRFKVAICTSSLYGYALRRIFEATACGCKVLTNLPVDEVLPEIDGNLTRIPSNASTAHIASTIRQMIVDYEPAKQEMFAEKAKLHYDYRAVGIRLAHSIEAMRSRYVSDEPQSR